MNKLIFVFTTSYNLNKMALRGTLHGLCTLVIRVIMSVQFIQKKHTKNSSSKKDRYFVLLLKAAKPIQSFQS